MMTSKEELLFDTKYVHIVWHDDLKGKKCFCSNDIHDLKRNVINGEFYNYGEVKFNEEDEFLPFKIGDKYYIFCYYDEDYEKHRKEILNK